MLGTRLDPATARKTVLVAAGVLIAGALLVVAAMPGAEAPAKEAAGGPAIEDARRPPKAPDLGSAGRAAGSLVVVLAIMGGLAVVAGRVLKRSRLRPGGERVLELVDAVPVGPKRQIYVVSAYGRKLIIGAAGDSLSLLSELGPDEIEPAAAPRAFEERLQTRERALEVEA